MGDKSGKKPLLSISILISGREEMKKCLESLHYFKDAFPCEVVLVDTGCNAEQRALAERYADKIIDFEWCDDFSAARNAGMKATEGEWFLYLDDDEWFDNPKEIVAFFLSGEYKNYNSGTYVIRNYRDMEGIMHNDSYGSRLVKRRPDIRFVGRIHEYLDPFPGPRKVFSDFAHHYGYAYQDEASAKRHSERNIEPLLKLVREEPGKNRWVLQLAQEYSSINEHEKAVDVCIKGLAEHKKRLTPSTVIEPPYLGAVYAYLITSLDSLGRYEEGIEWVEKAMAEPPLRLDVMKPTMAFYCVAGARIYAQMKEYKKCHEYFSRYMAYRREFGDNRDVIELGSSGIISELFGESIFYGAVLLCLESVIRMEDTALAEEAFYSMDWSDKRLLEQGKSEQRMLDGCCNVPYHPLWTKIMQTLVSREGAAKEMYTVFLTTEMGYKQEGDIGKISRLRHLVSEIAYDHHYILYTKILWENQKIKGIDECAASEEKIRELFAELFEKYPDKLPGIRKEVWDVAEYLNISMEDKLLKVDYRTWKDALEEWCREASIEGLQQWEKRIKSWKTAEDIRYGIFNIKCAEGYLFHYQKEGQGIVQWEDALGKYADSVLNFYRPLYRESVYEEVPENLPEEMWIALHLKNLRECRQKNDDKGALLALRRCIGVSLVLEKALEAYAEVLKKEIQKRDREAEKARQELKVLVTSLKAAARMQIEREEYRTAKEILLQIQSCVPEDEEVQEMIRQTETLM